MVANLYQKKKQEKVQQKLYFKFNQNVPHLIFLKIMSNVPGISPSSLTISWALYFKIPFLRSGVVELLTLLWLLHHLRTADHVGCIWGLGIIRSYMVTNWGCMVDRSRSGYYVSPGIWAVSEPYMDVHCLDGVPNNQPVPDIFFWCGCEVDRGPECNSSYSLSASQAVVLVNHGFAIKENNKHDLTSSFLLPHFFQSQLKPDRRFVFLEGDHSDESTTRWW